MAGKELDLYVLYHEVCKQGGISAVVKGRRWKQVAVVCTSLSFCACCAQMHVLSVTGLAACLHPPDVQVIEALELPATCTDANQVLQKNYYRWLFAFECQDVHGITLSKDEVERLAQGIEPGDGKGHSATASRTADPAPAAKAAKLPSPPQTSHAVVRTMPPAKAGAAPPKAVAAKAPVPTAKASEHHAAGVGPAMGGDHAARMVPIPNAQTPQQQQKRNIAMLPLHPPHFPGMVRPGLPAAGSAAGVWNGSASSALFSQQMQQLQQFQQKQLMQQQQQQQQQQQKQQQRPPPSPQVALSVIPAAGSKRRDGEDALDDAKRHKPNTSGAGLGAVGTSPGAAVGGALGGPRNPISTQQKEDERLAAGLVMAASASKAAPPAAPQYQQVAMLPHEKTVLASCRDQVRALGGPNIESLGWSCKIVPGGGPAHARRRDEVLFFSPQGQCMRSVVEVHQFLEKQGGNNAKPAAAGSGNGTAVGVQNMQLQHASKEAQVANHKQSPHQPTTQHALPNKTAMEAAKEPDEGLKLDEDVFSDVRFPLTLSDGNLVIENLGEIVAESGMKYHSPDIIYPVGYKARRTCADHNVAGRSSPQTYFCEVMHCGKQPLFRITPLTSAEVQERTAGNTASVALKHMCSHLGKMWEGDDFFGLSKPEVRGLIERLPGAHLCADYNRWVLGAPPRKQKQVLSLHASLRRDLCSTPMQECLTMLLQIVKHRCAWPFLEPVKASHKGLEDYGSRVQRPMDLGTVVQKLKQDKYKNPHECRLDVVQIWRNCLFYSGEKDDATQMARQIGEIFDSLYADRILGPMMEKELESPVTPEPVASCQALVGQKLHVYDSFEFLWRDGLITEYNPSSQLYKVVVQDDLDPKEQRIKSRLTDFDKDEENTGFNLTKTAPHRMPELLPQSVRMRLNRREQERQRRKNIMRSTNNAGGSAWDIRWMPFPSMDAVLASSVDLDGSQWNGEWPGKGFPAAADSTSIRSAAVVVAGGQQAGMVTETTFVSA